MSIKDNWFKEDWHLPEEQQWEIRRNTFLGNAIDVLCGSNNELWQKVEELEKRVHELEKIEKELEEK